MSGNKFMKGKIFITLGIAAFSLAFATEFEDLQIIPKEKTTAKVYEIYNYSGGLQGEFMIFYKDSLPAFTIQDYASIFTNEQKQMFMANDKFTLNHDIMKCSGNFLAACHAPSEDDLKTSFLFLKFQGDPIDFWLKD